MSDFRKPVQAAPAELVEELDRLSRMAAYLMFSVSDVMRSGDIPNSYIQSGYTEIATLVSDRLASAVDAVADRIVGEANHA